MKRAAHILVVDDDRRLRQLLRNYLTDQQHIITEAASAAEARELLGLFRFDVMVLDVMMPGESGLEMARNLPRRKIDPPPILMLTARDAADDRVAGLESGVEDYLTKPFEPRELLLRIGNILKRHQAASDEDNAVLFGDFRYLAAKQQLWLAEEIVHLTMAEHALLTALVEKKGEAISRETLADKIGEPADNPRKVDIQIARLRKKIEADTSKPRYIQTIRGEGYRLQS